MKKQTYIDALNGIADIKQFEYLAIPCSTRSIDVANEAQKLLKEGKIGEALELADPIAFELGFNDFKD